MPDAAPTSYVLFEPAYPDFPVGEERLCLSCFKYSMPPWRLNKCPNRECRAYYVPRTGDCLPPFHLMAQVSMGARRVLKEIEYFCRTRVDQTPDENYVLKRFPYNEWMRCKSRFRGFTADLERVGLIAIFPYGQIETYALRYKVLPLKDKRFSKYSYIPKAWDVPVDGSNRPIPLAFSEQPLTLAQRQDLKWLPYDLYLSSSHWIRCRYLTQVRDRWACVRCASKTDLHVHHLTYLHRGFEDLYLADLQTLCANCHGVEHGTRRNLENDVEIPSGKDLSVHPGVLEEQQDCPF